MDSVKSCFKVKLPVKFDSSGINFAIKDSTDFKAIEDRVLEIAREKYEFKMRAVSKAEALEVYKDNVYIASIGDSRYQDYPHYLEIYGEIYANQRKKLYHNRHKRNFNVKYSKQWLSLNLLW